MSTLEEDILELLQKELGVDEGHRVYHGVRRLFSMARRNWYNGLYTSDVWFSYYFEEVQSSAKVKSSMDALLDSEIDEYSEEDIKKS